MHQTRAIALTTLRQQSTAASFFKNEHLVLRTTRDLLARSCATVPVAFYFSWQEISQQLSFKQRATLERTCSCVWAVSRMQILSNARSQHITRCAASITSSQTSHAVEIALLFQTSYISSTRPNLRRPFTPGGNAEVYSFAVSRHPTNKYGHLTSKSRVLNRKRELVATRIGKRARNTKKKKYSRDRGIPCCSSKSYQKFHNYSTGVDKPSFYC